LDAFLPVFAVALAVAVGTASAAWQTSAAHKAATRTNGDSTVRATVIFFSVIGAYSAFASAS
jgi:hypothetical protein